MQLTISALAAFLPTTHAFKAIVPVVSPARLHYWVIIYGACRDGPLGCDQFEEPRIQFLQLFEIQRLQCSFNFSEVHKEQHPHMTRRACYLLDAGAYTKMKDSEGRDAFDHAALRGSASSD